MVTPKNEKKTYKVLFVMLYKRYVMSKSYEDLGIGYVGAYLRKRGYHVEYIACYDDEISYYEIQDIAPDIIGLPIYDASQSIVSEFCTTLRNILPHIKLCGGGIYPTICKEKTLVDIPNLDYAIYGESERSFFELVQALEHHSSVEDIGNLIYKINDVIIINSAYPLCNINDLPNPTRDVVKNNRLGLCLISGSRGCKSNCTFCTSSLSWKRWRNRSSENILKEIKEIINETKVRYFNFVDNSFEDNIDEISDLLVKIVREELNIAYFTSFRAEFQRIATPEMMNLFIQSGLSGACIGFETANQEDRKLYGKIATIEDNIKIINLFREYEIIIDPGFINFNPYSTFHSLKENIDFLHNHGYGRKIYNIINGYQMYEGTYLANKLRADKLYNEKKKAPYNYHFIDSRIEILHDYLLSYCTNINRETDHVFEKLSYFTGVYHIILNYLQRKYKNTDHILYGIIENHIAQLLSIFDDLNQRTCFWYRCLLNLAEQNWNLIDARLITEKYMAAGIITKIFEQFKMLNQQLLKQLLNSYKSEIDTYKILLLNK